jgi:hypothetical protein
MFHAAIVMAENEISKTYRVATSKIAEYEKGKS